MEPNRYTTAESWRIIWDIHFKELYLQNSIFKTYIYGFYRQKERIEPLGNCFKGQ